VIWQSSSLLEPRLNRVRVTPTVQPEVETSPSEDTLTDAERDQLHRVLVHNDPITPFDFVIAVLLRFFGLSSPDAQRVTWTAHTSGIALVATLPLAEAQKRVGRAHFAAGLEGYPLTFTIEPA
jgi:ATP-dependent Clp protease adaptor protein ClpS